jgi:hypothetical protein
VYAIWIWIADLLTFCIYLIGGEQDSAQQKFLEIPDRARAKYVDREYLTKTIAWPPAMIDALSKLARAVGDAV